MATHFGSLRAFLERCDEHGFGPNEIQRLIESWDVIKLIGEGKLTRETLAQSLVSLVNPYTSERVDLQWGYPRGWRPTTVEAQLSVLREYYSDLDGSHVLGIAQDMEAPEGADGIFVVPKLSRMAEQYETEDPYGAGYGQLLANTVLTHLADKRKFYNYRAGELGSDRLRMRQYTAGVLQSQEADTPGDFLVFPAQTGKKWGGYSPRNARWEMEHGNANAEFPLPAWVGGHILLTNPSRLSEYRHLIIDCPGDEYRFGPGGVFEGCLYFDLFDGGRLYLDYRWLDDPSADAGSGSGFVGA